MRLTVAEHRRMRNVMRPYLEAIVKHDFGADTGKKKQWEAFLRKGKLDAGGATLEEVCAFLHDFLMPLAQALAGGDPFTLIWPAGGPWR